MRGVRCSGGMTFIQAHLRNRRSQILMTRERHKWRSHEAYITDEISGGGLTRSSDETSVMEVERRGQAIQVYVYQQPCKWDD